MGEVIARMAEIVASRKESDLAFAGIAVAVAVTGGGSGRTMRVHVGAGIVSCKEAGHADAPIAYRDRTVLAVAG